VIVIESNPAFIIAAYAVTWVVLLGYVLHLVRKGGRVRSEYDGLLHKNSEELVK
jgi:CcmD family protein